MSAVKISHSWIDFLDGMDLNQALSWFWPRYATLQSGVQASFSSFTLKWSTLYIL